MGIDLKTEGKEGLSLYSIDDGYVSRVNISPYGYGLTVYINHPGGITSVYAHCSDLHGKLSTKINAIQREKQSSELEVYFRPNELELKRGEVFALSGNSGSSRGPHLHFEIRDSYTEEAFNPLLFGFKIADSRKPELRHIKLFSLDENGFLQGGTKEIRILKKENSYVLETPIQLLPSFFSKKGGIGLALSGVDFYDAFDNVCGLYGLKLSIDNKPFFEQKLDQIKFEHTRYINIYTDFQTQTKGRNYHKSFRNNANLLGVYLQSSLGVFQPKPNSTHRIKYEVYDVAGNRSVLEFELNILDGSHKEETTFLPGSNYYFPTQTYSIKNEFGELEIPMHCSYEPFYKVGKISSNLASMNYDILPVQDAYTVRLTPLASAPVSKQ
jgi:hypothetical protein